MDEYCLYDGEIYPEFSQQVALENNGRGGISRGYSMNSILLLH